MTQMRQIDQLKFSNQYFRLSPTAMKFLIWLILISYTINAEEDCFWTYNCVEVDQFGACLKISEPEIICPIVVQAMINVPTCQIGYRLDNNGRCRKVFRLSA